jgi:hypothetical protein
VDPPLPVGRSVEGCTATISEADLRAKPQTWAGRGAGPGTTGTFAPAPTGRVRPRTVRNVITMTLRSHM